LLKHRTIHRICLFDEEFLKHFVIPRKLQLNMGSEPPGLGGVIIIGRPRNEPGTCGI